jgi:hypothetical protein
VLQMVKLVQIEVEWAVEKKIETSGLVVSNINLNTLGRRNLPKS